MPPARLTDVMLPPGQSSWQARVHNKFEGFAQGFDDDPRSRTALSSNGGSLSEFAFVSQSSHGCGHSMAQN
jgi:hypothetical protein